MSAMVAHPASEMTLEEWGAMDEDDEGELVDGLLVEEEMPGSLHEIVVAWLVCAAGNWLAAHGSGFVLTSDAKFAVAARRGRKPDVSIYLPGRKPEPRGVLRVPPDIMVEVVSPDARDQRRDRVEKLADYAGFGVRWYWLVDPGLRTFEILELDAEGRYAHAVAATDAPIDRVPGCEGLALDVPALWREIDRLEGNDPA
jgi:Uma2 family endonuclease